MGGRSVAQLAAVPDFTVRPAPVRDGFLVVHEFLYMAMGGRWTRVGSYWTRSYQGRSLGGPLFSIGGSSGRGIRALLSTVALLISSACQTKYEDVTHEAGFDAVLARCYQLVGDV